MSDYTPPKMCPKCGDPESLCRCAHRNDEELRRLLHQRYLDSGDTLARKAAWRLEELLSLEPIPTTQADKWQCESCGEIFYEETFSHGRAEDDGRGNPIQVQCGPISKMPSPNAQNETPTVWDKEDQELLDSSMRDASKEIPIEPSTQAMRADKDRVRDLTHRAEVAELNEKTERNYRVAAETRVKGLEQELNVHCAPSRYRRSRP